VRLCATASVSHLFIPPLCVSLVDPKATLRCASLELRCPIAFIKSRSPFFRLLSKTSFARCPASKEDPPFGFGYPFDEQLAPSPLEASFSSPRVGASPFKALLLSDDRKQVSLFPLRSRAFFQNLLGFGTAPQRLISHLRSRTPLCHRLD